MSATDPDIKIPQAMHSAILPSTQMAGPALGAVTIVMSFLACLALGATSLVDKATDRWLARATSAVTVQIVDTTNQTAREQLPAVMRELKDMPGVANARPLADQELVALLEPWLGAGNVMADLPLPQLIEVIPDPKNGFAPTALSARIRAVAPGARLDTHGRWRAALEQTARGIGFFAVLVLVMVTLATATVIAFATRAGLLANREILLVLHQIGAQDKFISRLFARHFLKRAVLSSLIGTCAAAGLFYLLGDLIADARSANFFLLLLPVPLAAMLLSWRITHHYVMSNLAELV